MTKIVIFSDASIIDTENFDKGTSIGDMADVLHELPARSAGPHRIKTEMWNLGLTCEVVDFVFYFSLEEIDALCERLITDETSIVGVSTTFWFSLKHDELKREKLYRIIKHTRRHGCKLVFGGTLASNFGAAFKCDAVFDGFSEKQFIDYVVNEENLSPPPLEFDFTKSVIRYDSSDCLLPRESVTIEISRGCIFKCAFCAYPLNGKSKFDYIKNEYVLRDELTENYERFGITNYTFSDDTFNDSTYKLEFLHKIFTTLPFKISFSSYLRLDLLNAHKEQIDLLREMGLTGAFFGVETFNRDSGRVIGKNLDPTVAQQLLFDLKSSYWKDEINVTVGLISGLPFETLDSHKATLDWIATSNVDRVRPAALGIPNPLLDKYPFKSKFQLDAAKYGFYWPDPSSNNWKNMSHHVKTFEQASNNAKEIYQAAKSADKTIRGNFGLPLVFNLALVENANASMGLLTKMPIQEYSQWLKDNRDTMIQQYTSQYKNRKISYVGST